VTRLKEHCQHEHSVRSVVFIVGGTVLLCIGGMLYMAVSARVRDNALLPVLTTFDRIASVGIGALIGLLANPGARQGTQSVSVDNPPSDPIPTTVEKEKHGNQAGKP